MPETMRESMHPPAALMTAEDTRGRVVSGDAGFSSPAIRTRFVDPMWRTSRGRGVRGHCRSGMGSSPPISRSRSVRQAIGLVPYWPRSVIGWTPAHSSCGPSIRRDGRLWCIAQTGGRIRSAWMTCSTATTCFPVSRCRSPRSLPSNPKAPLHRAAFAGCPCRAAATSQRVRRRASLPPARAPAQRARSPRESTPAASVRYRPICDGGPMLPTS